MAKSREIAIPVIIDRRTGEICAVVRPIALPASEMSPQVGVAGCTRLRHFIRRHHFRTLIESGCLFLNRLDQFRNNDPEEGRYPPGSVSALDSGIGLTGDTLSDHKASREFINRELTYVHCWYGGDDSIEHMWRDYAQSESGPGVMLETTAERLVASCTGDGLHALELCRVTYADDIAVPVAISGLVGCRKRKRYEAESEIRLRAIRTPESLLPGIPIEPPRSIQLKVDLAAMLVAIRLAPGASGSDLRELHLELAKAKLPSSLAV